MEFLCPPCPMSWFSVSVFGQKVVFPQMPSWPGQQLLTPHGVSCCLQSPSRGLGKMQGREVSLKNGTLEPSQSLLCSDRTVLDLRGRREGDRTSFGRFVT